MSAVEPQIIWWRQDLLDRYRISRPTLWRWEKAGNLPPHDILIGERPGWYPATVIEFERRSAGA